MGQEAAGEGGAFIAPVPALVLISAQLLARLVAGRGHSLDNLVRVGLAAGHRDQGALGQGRGHQAGAGAGRVEEEAPGVEVGDSVVGTSNADFLSS